MATVLDSSQQMNEFSRLVCSRNQQGQGPRVCFVCAGFFNVDFSHDMARRTEKATVARKWRIHSTQTLFEAWTNIVQPHDEVTQQNTIKPVCQTLIVCSFECLQLCQHQHPRASDQTHRSPKEASEHSSTLVSPMDTDEAKPGDSATRARDRDSTAVEHGGRNRS